MPNGALTPSVGAGPGREDRRDPFPRLAPTWHETIALDVTVNAGAEESVVSSLIHGPFRIDEISLRSSAAGSTSQQVRFLVGDLDPGPTTVTSGGPGNPNRLATDSSRTQATYYATNVFERHSMGAVFRTGTARIGMVLNNTTAGAVTLVAHVDITHLAPEPQADEQVRR